MKAPFPIVEVVWLDASTDGQGWEAETDAVVKIPVVMTIGFLIKETEDGLLVASTACEEKTTNARIVIPRGMLKSMKYVRGKPKTAAETKVCDA